MQTSGCLCFDSPSDKLPTDRTSPHGRCTVLTAGQVTTREEDNGHFLLHTDHTQSLILQDRVLLSQWSHICQKDINNFFSLVFLTVRFHTFALFFLNTTYVDYQVQIIHHNHPYILYTKVFINMIHIHITFLLTLTVKSWWRRCIWIGIYLIIFRCLFCRVC